MGRVYTPSHTFLDEPLERNYFREELDFFSNNYYCYLP